MPRTPESSNNETEKNTVNIEDLLAILDSDPNVDRLFRNYLAIYNALALRALIALRSSRLVDFYLQSGLIIEFNMFIKKEHRHIRPIELNFTHSSSPEQKETDDPSQFLNLPPELQARMPRIKLIEEIEDAGLPDFQYLELQDMFEQDVPLEDIRRRFEDMSANNSKK